MIVSENPLSAPAKRSQGIPPTVLGLLSIGSVQFGAAIAKGFFDSLGPGGTVFLRISLATLALLLLWRPKLGGYGRREYGFAVAFGLVLAGMNLSLYMAIDHIPLGVAVTLEFVAPWVEIRTSLPNVVCRRSPLCTAQGTPEPRPVRKITHGSAQSCIHRSA